MDKKIKIAEISIAVAVVLVLLVLPFARSEASPSDFETIKGIQFHEASKGVIISEKLAHSDIYLKGSNLGKVLTLAIDFTPNDIESLDVGIRENSFWLSYPKNSLYQYPVANSKRQSKIISIPLTDKLVDKNGSVDLMFFATNKDSQPTEDEGIADSTNWILHSFEAEVSYQIPTKAQLKDYIKSKLTREVAL